MFTAKLSHFTETKSRPREVGGAGGSLVRALALWLSLRFNIFCTGHGRSQTKSLPLPGLASCYLERFHDQQGGWTLGDKWGTRQASSASGVHRHCKGNCLVSGV